MGITSHLRLSLQISSHPPNFNLFASSAAFHVVNASQSSSTVSVRSFLVRRPPSELTMLAIAALLVLSVTVQAAKYDYDGRLSYKYEDHDSYEPSYKSAYYGRDAYSEEPSYTYKASPTYGRSYEPRYKRSTDREGMSEGLMAFYESAREMAIAQGAKPSERQGQQFFCGPPCCAFDPFGCFCFC